jgi:hypothetical protein
MSLFVLFLFSGKISEFGIYHDEIEISIQLRILLLPPTLTYMMYVIFSLYINKYYNYYHKYPDNTMLDYLIVLFNETFNNL